ncbi:uncharacterized protein EDB93DRAFT_1272977 [Suillus bovinus]|uniref:uncharacterized protein n=1 Tax=Suillus bovinus TaxID=48563 RepID=UPI001B871C55|nr:uncharacterized protein EDB93DRAFT_1272977 [Suillus bovinus]KAG2152538.1 hypothetical protein EDB93DRAFT_1272977 [Suillus bovinus]
MLSVCRSVGPTALFTPNAETNHRIKPQLAQNAPANQISVESSTTLPLILPQPLSQVHQQSHLATKKAKKRNAASTVNTASTADPPQVTMDNLLKEVLASMQEIAEIQGKTESVHNEIKSVQNDSERIESNITSFRKDLDAVRVEHTQIVEALREVTLLLVPLHLRVLLDLARSKVLEHCKSSYQSCTLVPFGFAYLALLALPQQHHSVLRQLYLGQQLPDYIGCPFDFGNRDSGVLLPHHEARQRRVTTTTKCKVGCVLCEGVIGVGGGRGRNAKYYPDVEPSDMLSVCRSVGLTALFTPNAETNHRIKAQLAQNAPENQASAESSTTSATDTATTSQSSTSAVPPRKSKKAKKRNAALTANTTSKVDPPQATMDSQLKEMLALMQKEIAEIRGKNEKILNENESMRSEMKSMCGEMESMRNENERILNENESMRSEMKSMRGEMESMRNENERILNDNERINNDNERINSDVEALREVTLLLVALHLRVLLDLARSKVLEHLGHETWEGLRASCSVYQLSNKIFDDLKRKGVSYTPPYQSILFLCSYNNIRRAGNTAAHTAKENDIRHAVLTQQLDSQERACLENLFTYAYDGTKL